MPEISKKPPAVYVGIDPGMSGGIAVIRGGVASAVAMPATERDIWLEIGRHFDFGAPGVWAVIERNTGYVGGEGNPGSAMFKFGRLSGLLEMALVAASIPYESITPAVWQRALGIPTRKLGEEKRRHKNKLKAHAQQLFPDAGATLNTCDAILIAEYCRRKQEGKL